MPLRRQMSLRPIQTEKHEITWSNLGENASTVKNIELIDTVAGEPTSANEIETGSHVKWIFLETNLNGVDNSGTMQVFHWMVYKNQKGQTSGILDPAIYDPPAKANIIKRGMEMLPEIPIGSGGTVQTKRVFVIKIPKGMQRMAEQDKFILSYKSTSTSGINYCGIGIFREIK